MKTLIKTTILVTSLGFLTSCDLTDMAIDDELAASGHITNEAVEYTITYEEKEGIFGYTGISGANAYVTDDQNNTYTFKEKLLECGVYKSDPKDFTAVPGRTYTFHVRDGSVHLRSAPLKLEEYTKENKSDVIAVSGVHQDCVEGSFSAKSTIVTETMEK